LNLHNLEGDETKMTNIVTQSINTPIRNSLSWEETWVNTDQGLIKAWEVGRQLAEKDNALKTRALRNELPMIITWKGGVEEKLKTNVTKYGTLKYLAHLQGLRGEDLHVDLTEEVTLTCSRTGQQVTYTSDSAKYAPPQGVS